jgi:hypothetical protein
MVPLYEHGYHCIGFTKESITVFTRQVFFVARCYKMSASPAGIDWILS